MQGRDWLAGAAGGFAGTLPMTGAMLLLHRFLPEGERLALPPRPLTMRILGGAGLPWRDLPEPARLALVLASHYGYGAAAGALFPAFRRLAGGRAVPAGAAYGMLVWALSYLGWVPAARLLPPATRWPPGLVALMLGVHGVWGGTTGAVAESLSSPRPPRP